MEFEKRQTNFSYQIKGLARFRANIFLYQKGVDGVFRIFPAKMTTPEKLELSQAI